MPHPLTLMYHGFGHRSPDADPHNLFVPAAALERQLVHLLRRGWRPLDEAGFLAGLVGASWPRRSFLVTIDDGYVSTLDTAAPVLHRLGVPAVLFALAGMLGGRSRWMPEMPDEPLLSADQLRRLPDEGVSIGLHGMDHPSMAGLPPQELRRQTVDAAVALAEATGMPPRLFAYPFGTHDATAREAVANAGLAAAFAIYDDRGRFALPRIDINALDTPRSFALKTSRVFPTAKKVLDRTPAVRRLAHRAVGAVRRT